MESTRKFPRYNCSGSADLLDSENHRCWGQVADISVAGFYVSTYGPLPINTEVSFEVEVEGHKLHGKGKVVTSHPGVGMAVVFHDFDPTYKHALDEAIKALASSGEQDGCPGLQI
jgi:hypothetical protein